MPPLERREGFGSAWWSIGSFVELRWDGAKYTRRAPIRHPCRSGIPNATVPVAGESPAPCRICLERNLHDCSPLARLDAHIQASAFLIEMLQALAHAGEIADGRSRGFTQVALHRDDERGIMPARHDLQPDRRAIVERPAHQW